MRLIIQIPCFNEEKTLPVTVNDIPQKIEGIDNIELLIIDDGSSDDTLKVAKKLRIDHIVRNIKNRGLAYSFNVGIDACLRLGADIIVNTDGDNQYRGEDICKLISPILNGEAEIVVGNRQTDQIEEFSLVKKKLQKIGSFMVRTLSHTDIPDAVSGFRAFSREAAMKINILSSYSYTIETLIQAGNNNLAIESVPIRTNLKTRESRLFKSIPKFIEQSIMTMIRSYAMYHPLRVFFYIGCFFIVAGLLPSVRFVYYYITGNGVGHIQSLILSAILLLIGFQVLLLGLLADVISCNRKLIEETLLRIKKIGFKDRKASQKTSME